MGFMFHKQRNGHQSCISVMSHDNPCPRTLITLCQIPKALWRTLFRYVPHAFDSTNRRVFCWYSWKLKKKLNKRPKGTRKRGHEELQTTPVNKGPDLGLWGRTQGRRTDEKEQPGRQEVKQYRYVPYRGTGTDKIQLCEHPSETRITESELGSLIIRHKRLPLNL